MHHAWAPCLWKFSANQFTFFSAPDRPQINSAPPSTSSGPPGTPLPPTLTNMSRAVPLSTTVSSAARASKCKRITSRTICGRCCVRMCVQLISFCSFSD
ncbi:hypothetical protein TRVL_10383 [Trypanosoma vivax]|nr:hypothetical protein TRVL_10383 [Trypanosoma vivax]